MVCVCEALTQAFPRPISKSSPSPISNPVQGRISHTGLSLWADAPTHLHPISCVCTALTTSLPCPSQGWPSEFASPS